MFSNCVHPFLSDIFDKGPESLLLMFVPENGLDCSVTKIDEIMSAQIEGLGNQQVFVAQATTKDADIVRLHRAFSD